MKSGTVDNIEIRLVCLEFGPLVLDALLYLRSESQFRAVGLRAIGRCHLGRFIQPVEINPNRNCMVCDCIVFKQTLVDIFY